MTQKSERKAQRKAAIMRTEWSGNIFEKGMVTREGGFKTWQEAERWVKWKIKEQRNTDTPTITLGTVCHVEKNDKGQYEDVDVIRFMPSGSISGHLMWIRTERKRPWFEGHYQ